MNKNYTLGIDIGGTNTKFGLVDAEGHVMREDHVSTPEYATANELILEIFDWVKLNLKGHTLLGIGIGAPSANFFTGCIEYAPNLRWKGIIELKKITEDIFKCETVVTNDANAAALGEMMYGCAKGLTDFVEITLGTGLGSGIICAGKLLYGHDGMAGEYGHISIDPNGRDCGCGRKGCLETYASSTGVTRSIKLLEHPSKSTSNLFLLEHPSAKDVFELATKENDEFSNYIIDYTAQILGFSLANFAAFSNPSAYVLFGGIAQSGQYFLDKVKTEMERNMLINYQGKVTILLSALHDRNAAVLGSAALAFQEIKI